MDSSNEKSQLELLKDRIPYIQEVFEDLPIYDKTLNRLLDDSKNIGLSLRFPYQDYSDMELPKKYNNWQLRCCEQLYTLIGTVGIKQYAENGLSWTRDSAYIPYEITSEIEPVIGYIKKDKDCGGKHHV